MRGKILHETGGHLAIKDGVLLEVKMKTEVKRYGKYSHNENGAGAGVSLMSESAYEL